MSNLNKTKTPRCSVNGGVFLLHGILSCTLLPGTLVLKAKEVNQKYLSNEFYFFVAITLPGNCHGCNIAAQ